MLAAGCTMWDTLSWGGETQALIYNPHTKKVIGINALGVAPTGATAEFYHSKGYQYPPEYGPLAAVTPGTPGGLMMMLAEYGTMSLADVLAPAIQMADGYPIEAQLVNTIERDKEWIKKWKYSPSIMLAASGGERRRSPATVFVQHDLAATWRKLVEAERTALKQGKTRKQAIYAAYDRFYKGDIAREIVRGVQEDGGLFTLADLANWKVRIEEPVSTTYKGITVYKLPFWQQGPAMLQALNILENADLKSMGYNSPKYIHTRLSGDEPRLRRPRLLLRRSVLPARGAGEGPALEGVREGALCNDRLDEERPEHQAGRSVSVSEWHEPVRQLAGRVEVDEWRHRRVAAASRTCRPVRFGVRSQSFYSGTTSIEAADSAGWVVSVTPSGGWVPAVIAGHTGIGLSQRAQSFVTEAEGRPVQRHRAGQASARDADADARAQGRRAVSRASRCRAAIHRIRTCCSSS